MAAAQWPRAESNVPTRDWSRTARRLPAEGAAPIRENGSTLDYQFGTSFGTQSRALLARNIVALAGPDVDLPGPRDLLFRVEQHFFPLRNPAGRSRNGKQDRKHLERE